MQLLAALLLVQPGFQIWNCSATSESGQTYMSVSMSFWGPGKPIIKRPYLAVYVRDFSYDWKPQARLLEERFRDPTQIAFPLPLERKPSLGHVMLTAPGEEPIRVKLDGDSLLGWDSRHGAYLQVGNPEDSARLLRVSRWTATVRDRRGRVQEVAAIASPSREEVRPLYDLARRRMTEAARDPARSPLCELAPPRENEESII
jgi:hypothetical protein